MRVLRGALRKQVAEGITGEMELPRAPADSVYAFLVQELQQAIPDLPLASVQRS